MQFQSDILGCTVSRSASADASALGAAYLAGLAAGLWRNLAEIEQLPRPRDSFEPVMTASERQQRYAGWQAAVARTTMKP